MGNRKPQARFNTLSRCLMLSLAVMAVMAGGMTPLMDSHAQTSQPSAGAIEFDIPAGGLGAALDRFAEQSGLQVVSDQSLQGVTTTALRGRYAPEDALRRLLQDSGFAYERLDAQTLVLKKRPVAAPQAPQAGTRSAPATARPVEPEIQELGTLTVTGTRIRGGSTPSPVIRIDYEQIVEDGHRDLGEVIRAIPQNFAGGQNPGVALGASLSGIANQNLTGGSALNLRGLGADASLTLLNGRRLSYSGFTNAIDISVIPIGALDRVEIVADGASAIYGSDAVAGVANIITRRDFDGVRADVRIGAATDGGGDERRYGLTAGTTWNDGGVIAAYEYTDTDAIFASQRSYLAYMSSSELNSILPDLQQHSLFLSAYQDFGEIVTLSLDIVRSERDSRTDAPQPPVYLVAERDSENTVIAPTLEFHLPREWSLSLGGSYARDKTVLMQQLFILGGVHLQDSGGCYCNTTRAFEIGAEGPVLVIPGGDVRTAVGAGWRDNDFENRSYTSSSLTTGERSSRYAYGEVLVPLISPEQGFATQKLDLTAAARYEDYDDMGSVTTPKLGLVYQPSMDFTLKTSWGKSFKAPNLMQQYQSVLAYLRPAAIQGAVGYPADATALTISGGNPDLKPERAESWTASVLFHPQSIPGLQLELGVFDVDYTDRVVQPISNIQATFRDPVYAEFIVLDPAEELLAEAIGRSNQPILNATGTPYDPSKVMGLVYGTYANVASQRIRGVDLSGTYGFALGGGRMTLRGSGSWLESRQRNSPTADEFDVAGKVFNPTKFRARAGATWRRGPLMLASFVNHVGGVTNNLAPVETEIASFTTIDANARYAVAGEGAFGGFELGLSVQNLLDRAPPLMDPLFDFDVNYDSTNHSAIGRFVSLSVSKRW